MSAGLNSERLKVQPLLFFSRVYLNLQKATDDPASVGVGEKNGEEKGIFFSWFCADLEAWDWDRDQGNVPLCPPPCNCPLSPTVGTRRRQFVLFIEVQLCQDRKSLWRFRSSVGVGTAQAGGAGQDHEHAALGQSQTLQSLFPSLLTPSGNSAISSLQTGM